MSATLARRLPNNSVTFASRVELFESLERQLVSTLIFLRHGHSAANAADLLTGQLPGIGLSKKGKSQAVSLVERIGNAKIDYLHVSPIERCQLTIDPWLRSKYSASLRQMNIVDEITEIDFGLWSGRKISSLRRLPLWKQVQQKPSTVTFPEGESFKKAQKRAVSAVTQIAKIRGDQRHLIVSHSDVIKLITAALLGMKLDKFQSIQIAPATFTIFKEDKGQFSLVTTNSSSSLKDLI